MPQNPVSLVLPPLDHAIRMDIPALLKHEVLPAKVTGTLRKATIAFSPAPAPAQPPLGLSSGKSMRSYPDQGSPRCRCLSTAETPSRTIPPDNP